MGIDRCICYTNAKLAIKTERENTVEYKPRHSLFIFCILVIFFAKAKSDIIAIAIVILKPCGFSDILFAPKLAQQISLGTSPISLPRAI